MSSLLDPGQIIKKVYDSATETIRVAAVIDEVAVGNEGDPVPDKIKLVAGKDENGDARAISVSTDGVVAVSLESIGLPTGASTSALQTEGNTSLSNIDEKLPSLTLAGRIPVDIGGNGSITVTSGTITVQNEVEVKNDAGNPVPISAASLPLPTGASTEAKQDISNTILSSVDTRLSGTLLVDGSAVVQPVSATNLDIRDLSFSTDKVDVSGSSVTVTGVATEAKQDAANSSLGSIDSKLPSSLTVASSRLLVDGSGVTQPVSVSSLPRPDDAARESTLSSLESKIPANITVASSRLLVDGSGVTQPTKEVGLASVGKARIDYTTPVTTTAYTQVIASTSAEAQELNIFDSSGQTLVLATGAESSEVEQMYIFPGGNGTVKLRIPAGTRIAIKAVSGTANAGEFLINLLG